jgi:transcriptional regulator with XRE-family HTH domain
MPATGDRVQDVLRALGANVQAFRVRAGLTQHQLAERADMDLRFLQRIERGAGVPSVPTIVALADAVGAEVADLFRPAEPVPARRGRPPRGEAERS